MASGGMESAYLALSSLFSTSYTPARGCLFNSFTIPSIVTEVPLGDMQFDYVTYCMLGSVLEVQRPPGVRFQRGA